MSFSSHFRNLIFVVFGNEVTKILHNSLITFFTEQGKTGKYGTHGNENLATYFWNFGSFDKRTKLTKYYIIVCLLFYCVTKHMEMKISQPIFGILVVLVTKVTKIRKNTNLCHIFGL